MAEAFALALALRGLAELSLILHASFHVLASCFQTRHSTLATICSAHLLWCKQPSMHVLFLVLANDQFPFAMFDLLRISPADNSLFFRQPSSALHCLSSVLARVICRIIKLLPVWVRRRETRQCFDWPFIMSFQRERAGPRPSISGMLLIRKVHSHKAVMESSFPSV